MVIKTIIGSVVIKIIIIIDWARWQPDNCEHKEDKLMIYKGVNPINPNKFGEWNDLCWDGTCKNESFFGISNFGFICEWEQTAVLSGKSKNINLSYNTNVIATYFVVNCRESITLRSAPSVYADEITQIPLGQAVGFIENAGNGFYKINYDGLIGYALAQYLSPNKYGGSSVRYARVVNCRDWISLREYPDTNSYALRRIPGNGFYRIEYDGIVGYALQAYLELE